MARRPSCCCDTDLRAVGQAAIDQLVGFSTMVRGGMVGCTGVQAAEHILKVTAFLQPYLDEYSRHHGSLDSTHMAAAEQALLRALGK